MNEPAYLKNTCAVCGAPQLGVHSHETPEGAEAYTPSERCAALVAAALPTLERLGVEVFYDFHGGSYGFHYADTASTVVYATPGFEGLPYCPVEIHTEMDLPEGLDVPTALNVEWTGAIEQDAAPYAEAVAALLATYSTS